MKKLAAFGAFILVLGMTSCKTYCPAYNYASVEVSEQNAPATAKAETTEAIKG
ncbi:hypothetical protein H9Q13_16430 [Pontibacter sp. JH31]|uniref:Uncharacterized protein n=1 Tax=Pontibacter aquaedesilientis TaxID=2766980 RepID=A0ABR7XKE5_9BACT|nr:hypothetical protein [Pontibacter aquaedesilientis]MBD1398762.1 hypothetical protein [Pontibacter aquaedesilientis]